jgi:predicted O-methyltransferase YrrM
MDVLGQAALAPYLDALHAAEDPVEAEMEAAGVSRGFPIVGPRVGRLCAILARGIGARRVFEMGSGFGYSTLHFARAVGPAGRVVHTDGSDDLSAEARGWMAKARLARRVDFRVGDARDILRRDRSRYDVVFIDIDKHQYPDAWSVAAAHVRKGGLVITDNTLWSGRVADPARRDADTKGVRRYTKLAFGDRRFLTTIVPVRDGVAVSLRL